MEFNELQNLKRRRVEAESSSKKVVNSDDYFEDEPPIITSNNLKIRVFWRPKRGSGKEFLKRVFSQRIEI